MTEFTETYQWCAFGVRVVVPINGLDHSFSIQEWCRQNLGDRWATTPPAATSQEWYFVEEADATLFRLRWTR